MYDGDPSGMRELAEYNTEVVEQLRFIEIICYLWNQTKYELLSPQIYSQINIGGLQLCAAELKPADP